MANLRWTNSLSQPESDNGTGGEKLETMTNLCEFSGFKVRILKI